MAVPKAPRPDCFGVDPKPSVAVVEPKLVEPKEGVLELLNNPAFPGAADDCFAIDAKLSVGGALVGV